jgi:excinuclease ABC subunit A
VIDLGPGGGVNGGQIVVTGTPEDVAAEPKSFTGQYLKPLLERSSRAPAPDEEEPSLIAAK